MTYGPRRFKELAASVRGIPTNILSVRLDRLLRHGLIARTEATDGGRHHAYRLTDKGEALQPVLAAIIDWSVLERFCFESSLCEAGHDPNHQPP